MCVYVCVHMFVVFMSILKPTHTDTPSQPGGIQSYKCVFMFVCVRVLKTHSIKNLRPSFYYNLKVHCVFPFEIINYAFCI